MATHATGERVKYQDSFMQRMELTQMVYLEQMITEDVQNKRFLSFLG